MSYLGHGKFRRDFGCINDRSMVGTGPSAHDKKSSRATEAAHLLGVRGPEGEILLFWKWVF